MAVLAFVGVAAAVAVHAVARRPAGARALPYLGIHVALAGVMLASAWLARRHGLSTRAARWLVGAGIATRVALLPVAPFTTHDVERYLWDGHLVTQGRDPYRVSPGAPEAATLAARWPTPREHHGYVTLYPPLALGLFALSAAAGPTAGVVVWKAGATAASIGIMLVLLAVLRRGGALHRLPWVVWHPLLLLEAGVGAHADVLAALAVVLAASWAERRRVFRAGAAVGLGVLCKLTPAVMLPSLVARAPRAALGATSVLALGYGAALLAGLRPYGSLGVFVRGWRFGSPLFAALEALAGATALPLALAAGGLALAVLAGRTWHARSDGESSSVSRDVIAAWTVLCALSPVVFPWYLLPLTALLALRPTAWLVAWTLLHPLTYEVLDRFDVTGRWEPSAWPLWVIALGVGLAVAYDTFVGGRVGRRAVGADPPA